VTDLKNIRLLKMDREIDVQAEVTARYNDGSIKWLLVDFDLGVSVNWPESRGCSGRRGLFSNTAKT